MRRRFRPVDLARTGLFSALIVICTWITVPLPSGVPLTLQTFAVALSGFLLGPAYGTLAAVVFLLLGAAGLPVFSGFTGGVGRFVGPTGGFLWGFLPLAAGCGLCFGLINSIFADKPLHGNIAGFLRAFGEMFGQKGGR